MNYTQQLSRIERAIAGLHKQYDPTERMLKVPFSSPGYHTTLKGGMVHPNKQSLEYALALLDTEKPEWIERGKAILERVVGLQDTNPASKTFGIWSWFLEEPLSQMSPPDYNWADFCGVSLLQVVRVHREKLSPELRRAVEAAILNACRSIVKRNVSPSYTNIAVMDAYVTLMTGELLQRPELLSDGLARLGRFAKYTQDNGAFEEYNSPTYTIVALSELSRVAGHIKDPRALALVQPLVYKAWEEFAGHFHAPTRQWAGPHSRAYASLLSNQALSVIQRGTQNRVSFGVEYFDREEPHVPLVCPRALEPLFGPLSQPRTVTETFIKRVNRVGTTYLHPDYALGTVNQEDLWNQRRALLLYFGDAKTPGYAHLRFLKNGYDFSSAILTTKQREGLVVGAVTFITNGGDTHISLDKVKNATIKAKDLRLRLELGGPAAKAVTIAQTIGKNAATLTLPTFQLRFITAMAQFGEFEGKLVIGGDDTRKWVDIVLYEGDEREFNLAALDQALLAFTLRVGTQGSFQGQGSAGSYTLSSQGLSITVPTKPGPRK
ncbi:hypothetical protein [Armatimonas rosea]|uniref:Heparinase II/III-like protein n=1 Tax=Armatimonas rosea TaxID=685828 RepID=A0A7W9SPK2_ARMRO|nr:hypothetical protein [Armatimonas rosea]MBB6050110.1 hypothetical protein [Armatimonas rosea]